MGDERVEREDDSMQDTGWEYGGEVEGMGRRGVEVKWGRGMKG